MFLGLKELERGKLPFKLKLEPGKLDFLDTDLQQSGDLTASGSAELRAATGEILIKGSLQAVVEFQCDRCVKTLQREISQEFELTYLPLDLSPSEGEVEIQESDIDVDFYEGGGVELFDVIREQILLALPTRRVCEPPCGAEALIQVANAKPETDPRWDALKDLFPGTEKEPN
jgi:uncharacterized protein